MKVRSITAAVLSILMLNLSGFAYGPNGRDTKKRPVDPLVAMLPASDGVAVLNARRFFSDAVPQVFSANQPLLSSITSQIDNIEAKTGIDLRKFDSVVIGIALKKVSEKEYDFDPVAIARGELRSGALLAIAKLASNGTYREEKYGEKTIYIFTAKDVLQKSAAKTSGSKIEETITKALDGLTRDVAVTAVDGNTLAFGSLTRVREALDGKTHVTADITSLLGQKETSVVDFALKTPTGMSKLLPLDNDELGANIDSIRFVSGSIDVASAGTSLQVTAKTVKGDQAQGLYETLDGLKLLGKAFFGGSKRPDQKVYARLIDNAKISIHGNSVTIDLLVPQSDIDALIGAVK